MSSGFMANNWRTFCGFGRGNREEEEELGKLEVSPDDLKRPVVGVVWDDPSGGAFASSFNVSQLIPTLCMTRLLFIIWILLRARLPFPKRMVLVCTYDLLAL